jgi:hypothetical protein
VKSFSGRNPVFVDATGRRHRTIRRAGAFLAVPAVGYVVVLASSLLGGPTVDTPLIPLPDAVRPVAGPRPVVTSPPGHRGETPQPKETTGTSDDTPTPTRTDDPTASPTTAPSTPATRLITGPTVTPSTRQTSSTTTPTATKPPRPGSTLSPTSIPTRATPPQATPGHRKPTAPPGQTRPPKL